MKLFIFLVFLCISCFALAHEGHQKKKSFLLKSPKKKSTNRRKKEDPQHGCSGLEVFI